MVKAILEKTSQNTVRLVHSKAFHGGHGIAHFAYLVVIVSNWHGTSTLVEASVIGLSMIAIMGGGEA